MVGQFWHRRLLRWRAWIPLYLARRPAAQMFEDSPNDCGVIDQRDDVHRRSALGTLQRIDLVDLVDEPRPRRPGARRSLRPILG